MSRSLRLLTSSFSTRLVLVIGFPAILFLFAILGWLANKDFREAEDQTRRQAMNLARLQAAELDRRLSDAARIPEMHASALEGGTLKTVNEVQNYLTNAVARNREVIYGSCLAFELDAFPGEHHFCPYAYWKDGQVIYSDLTPPSYNHFDWDWYKLPKVSGRAQWTEPFYDEGGGNTIMTTRTVPLYKPAADGTTRVFWGVATIDIALSELVRGLEEIKVAESGYVLLISPEGRFLAHPDKSQLLKFKIQDAQPELARQMMSQREGFVRLPDPMRQQDAWIAFTTVTHAGFTLALVYPAEEVIKNAKRALVEMAMVTVVSLVLLWTTLIIIARSVTRPIRRLAAVARKISDGDLNQQFNESAHITEVRDLSLAFDKMTRNLRMQMEEIRYNTAMKSRLLGELNAARRIQMSMLPKPWATSGEKPHHTAISLHAVIQPAREIGGDFYDHRFLDDRRLSVLMGDVSGKGTPAALFMAMTQTLIKGYAAVDHTAAEIMTQVNNALCHETHTGMFVTLVYIVLDVTTGEMEVCNAGHLAPLRIQPSGEIEALNSDRHPALGLIPNHRFTSNRFKIKRGDRLVCYTDGVTEALDSQQTLFGLKRLEDILRHYATSSVEEMAETIMTAVRSHAGNAEASDDITVLAIKLAD